MSIIPAKFTDKVVIFTLPKCKNSMMAKALIASKGVAVKEYDATLAENYGMLMSRGEFKTVPQIFVNDVLLGGYSRLVELNKSGELMNFLR
jgi:glutaredoxin